MERQKLAALSLSQAGISTGVLTLIGNEEMPWCLEHVQSREADTIATHIVEGGRKRMAPFVQVALPQLSAVQHVELGNVSYPIARLGTYRLQTGSTECLASLEESHAIAAHLEKWAFGCLRNGRSVCGVSWGL